MHFTCRESLENRANFPEILTADYSDRPEANAKAAEGTLWFGSPHTNGKLPVAPDRQRWHTVGVDALPEQTQHLATCGSGTLR
jgi:hypothetical protein